MKLFSTSLLLTLTWSFTAGAAMRPQNAVPADSPAIASAPTLVRIDGQVNAPTGEPRLGPVMMVVSLYAGRDDATPLWVESQLVTLDAAGRYTLFAGATRPEGVPSAFLSGSAPGRWLGVGVQGEAEQFRMMLVAVPYALKAREADTLTGKSASDFVLRENFGDTVKTALKASGVGVAGTKGSGPGTSSTAGALGKDDGTGATIFSTSAFEVGGNVGIGTPTPGSLLHVKGAGYPVVNVESTTVNGGVLQLTSSTNNWQTYNQGGDLHFSSTSAPTGDRIAFTSSGNVGIGTTSPGAALDVNRSLTGPTAVFVRNPTTGTQNYARLDIKTDGAGGRGLFDAYSSTFTTIGNSVQGGVSFTAIGAGGFSIALADPSAAMRFYTGVTPSERMRIDNSGNVGIGTTTPTQKLDVVGNINVSGNVNAKYQDVAEWVDVAAPLEPGTIVVIDPAHPNRVMPAARAYDTRVAGAVSERPGLLLGEAGDGKAMVAQSGRVRIKADATYGAVAIGDLLVTSPTAGYAMRARSRHVRPGTVLGKALECLPNGQGEILALLTLQ